MTALTCIAAVPASPARPAPTARDLQERAEQFQAAALALADAPGHGSPHNNAAVQFLALHATELALSARLREQGVAYSCIATMQHSFGKRLDRMPSVLSPSLETRLRQFDALGLYRHVRYGTAAPYPSSALIATLRKVMAALVADAAPLPACSCGCGRPDD